MLRGVFGGGGIRLGGGGGSVCGGGRRGLFGWRRMRICLGEFGKGSYMSIWGSSLSKGT